MALWKRSAFVRYALVGALGFALGGTGGILAAGTIPGPGGLLTACYLVPKPQGNAQGQNSNNSDDGRRSGQLRLVADASECKNDEKAITFNQTGPKGDKGDTGVGTAGATGARGDTGVVGLAGATGPIGATGAAGPGGPTGPAGPLGPTGATGAIGASGPVGAEGATGATGIAGPTGPTGPAGSGAPAGSGVATFSFVFNNAPWTAGVASTLTVTVVDAFGHTANGYRGTVHFTSSDPAAVLPADYTFTAADSGTHTFSNGVTLFTLPSQTVTVTDTLSPSITLTAAVTLVVGASNFSVAFVTNSGFPTAGVDANLILTALDTLGNTVTGYRGTVSVTSSDPAAKFRGVKLSGTQFGQDLYTFTAADSGTHMFANGVTLFKAGMATVTATDTVSPSISGRAVIVVEPAPASSFKLVVPSAMTAGVAADLTVTALDAFGNTATRYFRTVHFTSSDPAATLPADYRFQFADNGTHTFTNGVTFFTVAPSTCTGSPFSPTCTNLQTVTATDTVSPSITGTAAITVTPASASSLRITFASVPTSGVAGQLTFTVTALDAFGNGVSRYFGKVHFTSSDPAATLPADYAFTGPGQICGNTGSCFPTSGDKGTHTFTNGVTLASGLQTLTATDTVTPAITGTASVTVP